MAANNQPRPSNVPPPRDVRDTNGARFNPPPSPPPPKR